jgi:DNA replicative helicase MCM subunit Mcm2 (Cdc46/Mcm family)
MSINPADVRSISTIGPEDIGTTVTLHGVVARNNGRLVLTEPTEDITEPRLPIGVVVENIDQATEGAYVVVEGTLTSDGSESFMHVSVEANGREVFEPDTVDDIRSQRKAAETIMNVIREHGEPLPARYVIERAGRLDHDRKYVRDVLNKLLTGGALYSPRRGMVFGA